MLTLMTASASRGTSCVPEQPAGSSSPPPEEIQPQDDDDDMDVDADKFDDQVQDQADKVPKARKEKPRTMVEELRQSLVEQPSDETGKRRLSNAEPTR